MFVILKKKAKVFFFFKVTSNVMHAGTNEPFVPVAMKVICKDEARSKERTVICFLHDDATKTSL